MRRIGEIELAMKRTKHAFENGSLGAHDGLPSNANGAHQVDYNKECDR